MCFLIHAILLSLLATLAPAQQPQKPPQAADDPPPTIRVDVDVVNILCAVRDKKGGLVANLQKEDFILSEDSRPQVIKYFARETDLPLTLGLLVDTSGSQAHLLEVERHAASQFFSQVIRKKDMAFLISFGSDVELLQDFTGSPRLLQAGLDKLRVSASVGGLHPGPVPTISRPRETALYEAVYLAANEKLRAEVGRKALVLITDGVDVGSRIKLEEATEAAQKADAIIYSIYYLDPGAYGGRFYYAPSDQALKRMSEETGGRLFRVDRKNTLLRIFEQLQEEIRSQYAIGYAPANVARDGNFRRVEIRTRQTDLKVQARKGYYSLKPESSP